MKEHVYRIKTKWSGNLGDGTKGYKSYSRNYEVQANDKQFKIPGSSDPGFRGDKTRYNPEDITVSAVSSCHMLWFLHLCSVNDVIVTEYTDSAVGVMQEIEDGSGKFIEVTLHPNTKLAEEVSISKINELHSKANKMCFIANSCNFPIYHKPVIR